MLQIIRIVLRHRIWKDRRGQDLIEYALLGAFVTVAAGAVSPGIASNINVVFSKVNSILVMAGSS